MPIETELKRLKEAAGAALAASKNGRDLDLFFAEYLARGGKISSFLRGLKDVSIEERRTAGKEANLLRQETERKYAEKKRALRGEVAAKALDLTIPGKRRERGNLHPLTRVRMDIEDVFLGMGFLVEDTPEVEDAKFNFDFVNMPAGHPARDMMDTFWLENGKLLRTHTSAGQARVLSGKKPPLRVLIPGRVFRREATDASHETTFYQYEGIMIDENISLADFKGVIAEVMPRIMKREINYRVRPGYFPFVEPGIEVDIECFLCRSGCSVCKGEKWIEVMGAGMVHPEVLKNAGIDPRKYRGFAFGGSIDRIAMLRFGIRDIRLLWSGDLHFLKQF